MAPPMADSGLISPEAASTTNTDLIAKNVEYRSLPSIQRYVILQQTHAAAIVFARLDDVWVAEIVAGSDAMLKLPEVGIEIPLAEIHREGVLDTAAEATDA